MPDHSLAQQRGSRAAQWTHRSRPSLRAAAIVGLAAAWFTALAWMRPLALPDEGRYVGVAWEMLRSGQWLEPTLNGLPFLHKPPLWYWLTAAAMSFGGLHEWAARLASICGATLGAGALFLFVRRWFDEHSALRTLIVLATMPLFYIGAQFANHDMLVASFICACILLGAHAVKLREAGSAWRVAALLAFACAAMGVMTKGLIGVVLPGLVLGGWLALSRRAATWPLLVWPPGLALLAALTLPWMVALQGRHDQFFHYFFVEQQFQRYTAGRFNNQQAWWFYLPVLAVLCLPWTAWVVRASRHDFFKDSRRGDLRLLMACWVALVLLFFSVPQSKLIGYMLPVAPPLAFLCAEGFRPTQHRHPRLFGMLAAMAALTCVLSVVATAWMPRGSSKPVAAFLQPRMSARDRLVMLDSYLYDLPFYLRLKTPVIVAGAPWAAAARHDGERKELQDAAAFAKNAKGILISRDELARSACVSEDVTWVVGDASAGTRYPWLDQPVFRDRRFAIWRWPEGCPPSRHLPAE